MANLSTSSIFDKQTYDAQSSYPLFILPFSEHDVLQLQGIFVSFGIHTIKTRNVQEGRQIIRTILHSLKYYHTIGCISHDNDLPSDVLDIMSDITIEQFSNNNNVRNLEDFLAVHPNLDFIWIEFTDMIKNQYSWNNLKNIFDTYHVEQRMPVIIVMYEEI